MPIADTPTTPASEADIASNKQERSSRQSHTASPDASSSSTSTTAEAFSDGSAISKQHHDSKQSGGVNIDKQPTKNGGVEEEASTKKDNNTHEHIKWQRSPSPTRHNGARVNTLSSSEHNHNHENNVNDGDDTNTLQEDEMQPARQGIPHFWASLRRLNPRDPRSVIHSLNFFRWHVIIGLVIPTVLGGIFYACNTGDNRITITDSIFMCTSALTLTGLSSVLLADMSFGQQFILYLLMQFGSIQFVSLLVLYVRRATFSKRFDPSKSYFPRKSHLLGDEEMQVANGILQDPDELPQLEASGDRFRPKKKGRNSPRTAETAGGEASSTEQINGAEQVLNGDDGRSIEDRRSRAKTRSSENHYGIQRTSSPASIATHEYENREVDSPVNTRHGKTEDGGANRDRPRRASIAPDAISLPRTRTRQLMRESTIQSGSAMSTGRTPSNSRYAQQTSTRGGFPNPVTAIFSEGVYQLRKRTAKPSQDFELYDHPPTSPRADSEHSRLSRLRRIASRRESNQPVEAVNGTGEVSGTTDAQRPHRQASMPTSAYRFGRNSTVRDLSEEAHQKLAQLEISGMTLLIYLIGIWWIGLQLFCIILWAPYFSAGYYDSVFQQYNPAVSRTWFSIFQSASMLNNCGLSLIDGSLTPFRTCIIMLVPAVFLMVVGNLGYPIAVRCLVWTLHKSLQYGSKLRSVTAFVLAHPRRIFYYMFPPYETLALLIVVTLLTAIDWACFFLLDINYTSPVFTIPRGAAVISGLVQSVAVRSAGFYTIPLFQVAPALLMLYLFMMLFCVYPLALAIRATNVYEERALGINTQDEMTFSAGLSNLKRETGYTKFHLREQLAYDVWYILLAFWLIERDNIGVTGADPNGAIDLFSVLFEVSSAYANVGFSVGTATSDTSISGDLRHLSKLILCATMIRGRTRGLPVLVDRAILTPRQLDKHGDPPQGGRDEEMPAREAEEEV